MSVSEQVLPDDWVEEYESEGEIKADPIDLQYLGLRKVGGSDEYEVWEGTNIQLMYNREDNLIEDYQERSF